MCKSSNTNQVPAPILLSSLPSAPSAVNLLIVSIHFEVFVAEWRVGYQVRSAYASANPRP